MPASTRLRLAAVAWCLVLPAAVHGDAPPPDWFQRHLDFMSRDGGVFHTDNARYRSAAEPWEGFGLAWEKGPSGQTLRGRLFGLRDGEEAATFWEFYVFWHPEEGRAVVQQVGGDGTVGIGTLAPPAADGSQRSEQTFYPVEGGTSRVAHVARDEGDVHATESFVWADGGWQPRRTYVWHRVRSDDAVDAASSGTPRASRAAPIFRLSTDDFWLNLHQWLYVLGRAEAGHPDAHQPAVADAPKEEASELERLDAERRALWRRAVAAYAAGPSLLDPVFDDELIAAGNILARLEDRPTLDGVELDAHLRATLASAAPIYRELWWPAHRSSNVRWRAEIEPLLERHGDAILGFLTDVYGRSWPAAGYPVRIVAWSNWAGAFSTRGDLLIVSSRAAANRGLPALEIVFHEALHQWDDAVWEELLATARERGVRISFDLPHAMLFMAAGEAVRAATSEDYTPYAEVNGIWRRGLGRFKEALDAAWLPYLRGRGTREEAIGELVVRTAIR